MRTYYIYDIITDEYLGEVKAANVDAAELKAIRELNITIASDRIAGFTEKY